VDRERESVRVAGLGEELARAVRVVLRGFELLARAVEGIGEQLRGGNGALLHEAVGDGLAIDRHRQGLAHARVLERIALERLAVLRGDERRRLVRPLVQV